MTEPAHSGHAIPQLDGATLSDDSLGARKAGVMTMPEKVVE